MIFKNSSIVYVYLGKEYLNEEVLIEFVEKCDIKQYYKVYLLVIIFVIN